MLQELLFKYAHAGFWLASKCTPVKWAKWISKKMEGRQNEKDNFVIIIVVSWEILQNFGNKSFKQAEA